jgi:hypothetical protein
MEKFDMSALANINNVDEVIKALSKDMSALDNVTELNKRLQTLTALPVTPTISPEARKELSGLSQEQETVRKSIIQRVDQIEKNTQSLKSMATKEVDALKAFSLEIPKITNPELAKSLMKLSANFPMEYIARMSAE